MFLIGWLTSGSTPVALDGAMIVVAMVALNIFHPSRLLVDDEPLIQEKNSSEKTSSVTDV